MANESGNLFKVALFIGVILFVGSLMTQPWVYVGQPLPPNSTWGQLSSQIESFPQFSNPFAGAQTTFGSWLPVSWDTVWGGGTTPVGNYTAYGNEHGCSQAAPWNCINDPNGADNTTFIVLREDPVAHNLAFLVNVSGPTGGYLTSATVELRCNTPTGTPTAGWFQLLSSPNQMFTSAPNTADTVPLCSNPLDDSQFPITLVPSNITWSYCMVGGAVKMSCLQDGPSHANFAISFGVLYGGYHNAINITYISIHMSFSNSVSSACTGDFFSTIACTIGQGLTFVLNCILFLINGLVFIGQVLFWFILTVGVFFSSLFTLFGAQGAPPIIAGPFSILIIGLIFYLAFVFMSRVRGTGATG